MKEAIKEMHRQVGDLEIADRDLEFDGLKIPKGVAIKGLLVRHLVLPNDLAGSEKIFEFLSREISKNTFLNIMDQYFPCYKAFQYPELSRRITKEEFERAVKLARKFGLNRLYL
jgi:putative pyruvate formate lyase activating enzyme